MRRLILSLAAFTAFTACESAPATSAAPVAALPTTVSCQDAATLRQRSQNDQRRAEATKSDQEKIFTNSRANYLASLAIVADLICGTPVAPAEATLAQAFKAAGEAEKTASFYAQAASLSVANLRASEAISILRQQLATAPGK